MNYFVIILGLILLEVINLIKSAVLPPPWADPMLNPCISQSKSWQYLFWPQDGQCYKIFQIGYPCPETMELVPIGTKTLSLKAECRCPPTAALFKENGLCYDLFKQGPCEIGQYFSPQNDNPTSGRSKHRIGICATMQPCQNPDEIFWPPDQKCYRKFSRGPCPKGQLLHTDTNNNLTICSCFNESEMKNFYWDPLKSCYEHFTKGPCQENGHLFLPNRTCGCHSKLPHFHDENRQCYELGSQGPCKKGQHFIQNSSNLRAKCMCKPNHILYEKNENCYRPFTQGPCPHNQILLNTTTCIPIPCSRNYLYFPKQKTCYRIGSQGPCPLGQVVTFDLKTRPSIDGISYNGICGCTGPLNSNCLKEKRAVKTCEPGLVKLKNRCYKLYLQGPCSDGQWLVPSRQPRNSQNVAKCDCKPGFLHKFNDNRTNFECLPPSFGLVNYLNKMYLKTPELRASTKREP